MKILVDMDGVLCDYGKAHAAEKTEVNPHPQSRVGFFRDLEPIEGAIGGIKKLAETYDVFILTSPSIKNPHVWTEKANWIEKHLGFEWLERLVITKNKGLLHTNSHTDRRFLIDDHNEEGGRDKFFRAGDMYWFSGEDASWDKVLKYFQYV